MRIFIMTTALCGLMASSALAAGLPAQDGPQNAAVKPITENNASKPVAGANSFTEDQARSMIKAKGYTRISNLKMDKDGIWRGKATKNRRARAITVDYQGNVN